MSWEVVFAKQALKDAKKLSASGLKPKAQELLEVLASNPLQNPPPYEKLVGDLAGLLLVAVAPSVAEVLAVVPQHQLIAGRFEQEVAELLAAVSPLSADQTSCCRYLSSQTN